MDNRQLGIKYTFDALNRVTRLAEEHQTHNEAEMEARDNQEQEMRIESRLKRWKLSNAL